VLLAPKSFPPPFFFFFDQSSSPERDRKVLGMTCSGGAGIAGLAGSVGDVEGKGTMSTGKCTEGRQCEEAMEPQGKPWQGADGTNNEGLFTYCYGVRSPGFTDLRGEIKKLVGTYPAEFPGVSSRSLSARVSWDRTGSAEKCVGYPTRSWDDCRRRLSIGLQGQHDPTEHLRKSCGHSRGLILLG